MLYGMHEIECILALWLKGSHFRFWRMYYGLPSQLYLQLVIRLYIRIQATVTGFNYLLPSTGDSISASKSDLSSILADSGFNGQVLSYNSSGLQVYIIQEYYMGIHSITFSTLIIFADYFCFLADDLCSAICFVRPVPVYQVCHTFNTQMRHETLYAISLNFSNHM